MSSKFVLLQIGLPKAREYEHHQSIDTVFRAAKDLQMPATGITQLGKGAWLIDMQMNVPFLSRICDSADSVGVPYRLLFLEQEPEWITYGEWP